MRIHKQFKSNKAYALTYKQALAEKATKPKEPKFVPKTIIRKPVSK